MRRRWYLQARHDKLGGLLVVSHSKWRSRDLILGSEGNHRKERTVASTIESESSDHMLQASYRVVAGKRDALVVTILSCYREWS